MDLVQYPRIPCSRQQVQQHQWLQLQVWVRLQHPITLALEELMLLHIDICIVRREAEPSDVNAVDFIIASSKAKVARLKAYIKELSITDDVNESALDLAYEELKEMDPSTFKAKAGSILYVLSFTQTMMTKPTKEDSTCVLSLPMPFSSNPIFSSSMNPPIIWISELLSGSKPICPRTIITSHLQGFQDLVCTKR